MAKNGGNGGGSSKFSYPRTASELDAANQRAHLPFRDKMLPQDERGADALKAGHRTVKDCGMLTRPNALPGSEDNTPLSGGLDIPFESNKRIR